MRHLELFRYAISLGISLQEAERRAAMAKHDRAIARLEAKGWHA